jgi:hypothetical protein
VPGGTHSIARELHDTLLETIQGSKLAADHALKSPDDHARVEQPSAWREEATEQGRVPLNSLRISTTVKNEAFRRAVDGCRRRLNGRFAVGDRRNRDFLPAGAEAFARDNPRATVH